MIPGDPINAELNQIATAKNKPYPVHLTAYIHVMEADKTYQTLKVMSLDINRDYDNNIADELSIEVVYLPGSWSDLIYPYHENLEMTVVSSVGFTGNQAEVKRYKAYIKNPKNFRKDSPHLQNLATETIDRMDLIKLQFQLVPLLIEKLIPIQFGTNFVNCTLGDAISTALMNESSVVEGLSDFDRLQGVDMVEPDNDQVYENIPIPHSTKLLDLPNFLQKKAYGLYKQGMGYYIQSGIWYLYPKYRIRRRDSNVRLINIFISNRDHLKYTSTTYRKDGEDLFIIGSVDAESTDNKSAKLLNEGNGIRTVNPQVQGTDESVEVKDNKVIVKRANNVNEFNVVENKNGVLHAPLTLSQMDTNLYEQVSTVEGQNGKLYGIVWQNSAPDLIKPGSIVKVHYVGMNHRQESIEGVLLKCHHYDYAVASGLNSDQYLCVSGLFIFCKD